MCDQLSDKLIDYLSDKHTCCLTMCALTKSSPQCTFTGVFFLLISLCVQNRIRWKNLATQSPRARFALATFIEEEFELQLLNGPSSVDKHVLRFPGRIKLT